MAKKISLFVLIIMLGLLMLGVFSGCSSVKKHKSINITKSDSAVEKKTDVVVDKKTNNSTDNKTIATDETVVNVEFEVDTICPKNDVTIVAKNGEIKINSGGRKIKSIAATSKNSIDSSRKITTATTEKLVDKSKEKVAVKKENKAIEIDKKSSRSKIGISIATVGALLLIFLFIKKKKQQAEEII